MRILSLCVLLIALLSACSNDFDLTEDKKDIPVVYGLINPQDTAHYFRIERAFIDESTSALEIAQRPDSLYYKDAVARLVDTETDQEYTFEMVDGNLEGYLRNQGVFATAPNYLYKIPSSDLIPVDNRLYRFELDRGDGTSLVTSETRIVDNPTIVAPGATQSLQFFYNTLDPSLQADTHFEWKLTEGVVFDLTLSMSYLESTNGGPFNPIVLNWTFAKNITELEYDINGTSFYTFIASRLEEDPSAVRVFQNIDFILQSGGQEILDYVSVVQANLGITSSQDVPTFTNLSEGVGLVSSRNSIIREDIPITPGTLDSLVNGIYTKHLNFN